MDRIPIPKYLGGKLGIELCVLVAGILRGVIGLRLLFGGKGHIGHIGNGFDMALNRHCLLPGIVLIHKGQELIVLFQLSKLPLQVQCHQRERPHDDKAGHDHHHRGKGHKAVGKDGVEALGKVVA